MFNIKSITDNKYYNKAFDWLQKENGEYFLDSIEYCETKDVFRARLDRMYYELPKDSKAEIIVAIAGEIGNNSFDHNLGNWRDVPGIYFKYDFDNGLIVLADRGQGIRETIEKVKPEVDNDLDALRTAFLESISGRSPEQRGNGLKFVHKEIKANNLFLYFHSGNATLKSNQEMNFENAKMNLKGCLAIIKFK